jgi:non-ribosomal peptide synthase protein (TIGR01720 family)
MEAKVYHFKLDKELTSRIRALCHHGNKTRIDDILLSAVNIAFSKLTDSGTDNVLLMESHGRQEFMPDIDVTKTMGWFASPYPVKLPPVRREIETLISDVKEALREIPNEGIGFNALYLYREQKAEMPAVYFNYQGEFESDIGNIGIKMEDSSLDIYSFTLELTARIYENKLQFNILAKIDPEKAQLFADDLNNALVLVIAKMEKIASETT